jgi:hypothetical protein
MNIRKGHFNTGWVFLGYKNKNRGESRKCIPLANTAEVGAVLLLGDKVCLRDDGTDMLKVLHLENVGAVKDKHLSAGKRGPLSTVCVIVLLWAVCGLRWPWGCEWWVWVKWYSPNYGQSVAADEYRGGGTCGAKADLYRGKEVVLAVDLVGRACDHA